MILNISYLIRIYEYRIIANLKDNWYNPLFRIENAYILDTKVDKEKLKYICNYFEGEKDFKNYTIRSKKRIEMGKSTIKKIDKIDISCETKFKYDIEYDEYIIKIKGHSFLQYQIRKMIYMMIQYSLNKFDINYINKTFKSDNVDLKQKIDLAPSKGLLLNYVKFNNDIF